VHKSSPAMPVPWCALHRDGPRLELAGEIDHDNATTVAARMVAEVRSGARCLDLRRVTFLGAAGVRALLQARAAVDDGRHLELICSPAIFRVLAICRIPDAAGLVVVVAR
jgi:anti-anti-sigma factor